MTVNSSDPLKKPAKNTEQSVSTEATGITDSKTNDDDDDAWCEVEDRPSGFTDTLLQEYEPGAPVKGNRPLGTFVDKESEQTIWYNQANKALAL